MKTENIYEYLSYGLIALDIAAIAFNPRSSQADNNTNESSSRKRHEISTNILISDHIKVAEGDKPTAWLRYALRLDH